MSRRNGPLGRGAASPRSRNLPPFPTRQMFVLALCRICEPIAFMGIFPYIYKMVEKFQVTDDKSQIALYAGMVTSAFTLAEFSTGVLWGRLSDKIGRKPVLLSGLAGTALSVLIFGFSPNLWVALFARALGGLLNGNIGVLQTTVAELVKVKEHQPRAYTIMPIVWCLGSIIGPIIGGALAEPCETLPSLFPRGSIWEKFPYLLPNLFSAIAVFLGVIIGILFLEETHEEKRLNRDRGVELGKYLLGLLPWNREKHVSTTGKGDSQPLLMDTTEFLPGYRTNENSPQLVARDLPEALDLPPISGLPLPRAPAGTIFTRPVVLNIVSYGILAFHTMTYDQLLPVFLSTEPQNQPIHLPFKFSDGFGYKTTTVGIVMSVQGGYAMLSTMVLFPWAVRKMGPLRLFQLLALSYFMLYLLTPYIVLLPEENYLRAIGIFVAIVWKCTYSTMAYPSNAILLTNSAPTSLSLGTINGVAASTASLSRAFGPTISGMLYAAGLKTGFSGLPWWCSGVVTIAGAFISLQITEVPGRMDEKKPTDVESAPLLDDDNDDDELESDRRC
ncbi:hypothetical protein RB594_000351 [Gaeumannomyces avenae]